MDVVTKGGKFPWLIGCYFFDYLQLEVYTDNTVLQTVGHFPYLLISPEECVFSCR
jgi:hypothetical protein